MDTQRQLELGNKLYCTFSVKSDLDETIETIKSNYDILYGKIFVLSSNDSEEYICSYNVDPFNTSGELLENTILVHRKKESNSMYTINALNCIIRELNDGILDTRFIVPWENYRNSILLTQGEMLKKLNTKVYKIFELN
jgi:hypothetical protein